ncbi:MAG TPA: aspartate/glutamate racemase family protein [Thermoanaerobaculia bacterium]|nr:aspartate/glutamate racemase family protein [Thermoanaerobaculia bacterium]
MHILITDSGVGGLSVCAYAERFARTNGYREPVRLTFANAAPANDYGYNSMPTHEAKIETFDRFLKNVTKRFAPDFMYIACNTLSVLLPDTPKPRVPIKGIVETGVELILRELDPRATAMIFGTQTTIDSGVYPRLLQSRGVESSRVVSQACPGLADIISEDREGSKARGEVKRWVDTAIEKLHDAPPVVACLACTHYGYRKNLFAGALADAGTCAKVINPNESAVDDLFDAAGGKHRDADVQFVTRYAIPPATIEALTFFLQDISPKTVAAMQNFVYAPDLF